MTIAVPVTTIFFSIVMLLVFEIENFMRSIGVPGNKHFIFLMKTLSRLVDNLSAFADEERKEMGLSDSLVRISIGIDHDITRTYRTIFKCMKDLEIL